jgi:hypothetical protein
MSLPAAFRGRVATGSIRFSTLYPARRSRHQAASSAAVASPSLEYGVHACWIEALVDDRHRHVDRRAQQDRQAVGMEQGSGHSQRLSGSTPKRSAEAVARAWWLR